MNQSRVSRLWLPSAMWLAAVCLALGCDGGRPSKIGDVLAHPRSFEGEVVTIAGEVTGSLNVPFLRGFTVRDDTGEIAVVTERVVPQVGEKLRVRGHVNQVFAMGNAGLIVLEEETK